MNSLCKRFLQDSPRLIACIVVSILATTLLSDAAHAGRYVDLRRIEPIRGDMASGAEKTGYPVEILNLDQQLEADLGIDSIKRVEILSGVQERLPQVCGPATRHSSMSRTESLCNVSTAISTSDRPFAPCTAG